MPHKIDRVDQAIVRLLSEDGRMSSAEIARRIGNVSERSVRYRIDRLIRDGVIQVSAIVNPKALGFTVTADIFIEVEPGHVLDVARTLAEFECVSYLACSTGDRDVSIQVFARDNEELYRFVTEVVGNVPWVRKTNTVLLPMVLKDIYDWHIPDSVCVDRKEDEE
jgi:Lrp/AsnC family transcriptional regulator for asnA, asnC and gidA